MYLLFYRADGTITSVGELKNTENVGVIVLTKEGHDALRADMDSYIIDNGVPRKRTQEERRARFEELYSKAQTKELFYLKDDPNSILTKWKDEFMPKDKQE